MEMFTKEYNEEDITKILKCEENNLNMLKTTLSHMIEIGSNNTKKVEELVNDSKNKIALIKDVIAKKEITEDIAPLFDGENIVEIGGNREIDKILSHMVRNDDFKVFFDGVAFDSNFVKMINDDRNGKQLSVSFSSYLNKDDKKNGNFEKLVDSLVGADIGNIRIQYPSIIDDDNYFIKEYTHCKLRNYYTSPFDYESSNPRTIMLEICYGNLKFIDDETTD